MLLRKDKTLTVSISRSMIYIVNHFGKSRKIPNQVTLHPALIYPVLTRILFSVVYFRGAMWVFNNQSCWFLFILFKNIAITAKASWATHGNSNTALRNSSVKSSLMRYQNITSASLGCWTVLWKAKPVPLV